MDPTPWMMPEPLNFEVAEDTDLRTDYDHVAGWTVNELKLALNYLSKAHTHENPRWFNEAVIALTSELLRRDDQRRQQGT